jgi:hypothetical protein
MAPGEVQRPVLYESTETHSLIFGGLMRCVRASARSANWMLNEILSENAAQRRSAASVIAASRWRPRDYGA